MGNSSSTLPLAGCRHLNKQYDSGQLVPMDNGDKCTSCLCQVCFSINKYFHVVQTVLKSRPNESWQQLASTSVILFSSSVRVVGVLVEHFLCKAVE